MIQVAIVNASTVMTDAQLEPIVAALQLQVTKNFAPIWGVDADLVFVPAGQKAPPNAWLLLIQDTADEPGALGYHQTQLGIPWGIVGAKDDIANGANPSVTISHELLEMLADPYVTSVAFIDTQMGGFRGGVSAVIALEVCDAVEADELGYPINGIVVSDFVYPWWFGGDPPPTFANVFSFTGACKFPFSVGPRGQVAGLLPGGYIGIRQVRQAGDWTTVNAQHKDFAAVVDSLLPAAGAHTLLHDGTVQAGCPKFSRRARVLERLNK